MSIAKRILAKWEAPLILASWAFAFLRLLDASRFKSFLRPEFGFLLFLGLALLIAMLVAHAQGEDGDCADSGLSFLARLSRLAVMTLPLLFLFSADGSYLDADAFRKRSLGPGAQAASAEPADPMLVYASGTSAAEAPPQSASLPQPGLIELAVDPRAFDGKAVAASGMVCHDKEVEAVFGKDSFLVFRFAITCCAADARPISIVASAQGGAALKDSQWVMVEGILSAKPFGRSIAAFINSSKCESIARPEDPYAYP